MNLKKHKNNTKKKSILTVSIILLLLLSVGGTLAFLTNDAGPVINDFSPSKVTTSIDETFNNNTKTDVSIKNTGDTTAYIRAAVVITWQDADGNVYPAIPVEESDYTIEYNLSEDGWVESSDGFYYWTNSVKSFEEDETNCNTDVLIESCLPVEGTAPEGYSLCVEIIGSGIQSVPTSVVTKNWSSGVENVNEDGSLNIRKITQ